MKQLMKLLFVPFLLFLSCTSQIDENLDESILSQGGSTSSSEEEVNPIDIRFSRSSLAAFAAEGVSEVGIYVYMGDSLIYGKKQALQADGVQIPLPLGENVQTFVVANADELVNADKLSTAVILQNDNMQKPVFLSDVIPFTSDNSVKSLSVELKRLVGQAVFEPLETPEQLAGVTHFDALDVTFTQVGVGYYIKDEKSILQDVTVHSGNEAGFRASVYSFPTENNGSRTSIDVVYLKEGKIVNRTNGSLDTGIVFTPSKRSVVHMEILNEDWVENEWGR